MRAGTFLGVAAFLAGLHCVAAAASGVDATACLAAAERVDEGETLSASEKQKAHEACVRALAATASIYQKYQFEEADFAITGKRHTY